MAYCLLFCHAILIEKCHRIRSLSSQSDCRLFAGRGHETHGVAVANMDRSVRPGDDFFHYANGAWIQRTEIPPDRSYVGVWSSLGDLNRKRSADLIEEVAKTNASAGSTARKIADLYNSYMDEAAIEAKGLAPLRSHLDSIAAIRNKRDLARALGEGLRADVDPLNNTNFHTTNLFGLWVAPGFDDPATMPPTFCRAASKCLTAITTSLTAIA